MYLITHQKCVNCDIQNIAAQWSAFFSKNHIFYWNRCIDKALKWLTQRLSKNYFVYQVLSFFLSLIFIYCRAWIYKFRLAYVCCRISLFLVYSIWEIVDDNLFDFGTAHSSFVSKILKALWKLHVLYVQLSVALARNTT